MKKRQTIVELVQVMDAKASVPIDKSRLPDLIRLIDEITKLDVSDKAQQKKCITLLFRISWLVAELPRPLKFNSESPLKALGARNWVMLDYLSIALKKSQAGGQPWAEGQYSSVISSLERMNRYLVKLNSGEEVKNFDAEFEDLEEVVGEQLNHHCMDIAHEAIGIAMDLRGNQYHDDLTLFRTICIIGETAKIISPALRNKIIALFGEGSKILTHLTSLRDLIIHDKYSAMQALKSDLLLRDKIYKVVLPVLKIVFSSPNLDATQKPDCSEEAIASLAEYIDQIRIYEDALKANESSPPMPGRLDRFAKLLLWAVPFIDHCRTLEEFVERIVVNRSQVDIPEISLITDEEIRGFFLWKRQRLISFNTLKNVARTLSSANGSASQTEKKRYLEDYFRKAVVTSSEGSECARIIEGLSLLSESSKECLKLFVKGKQIDVKTEDNINARRNLIRRELKLRGEDPCLDYLEYVDFIKSDNYKACRGKSKSIPMIDHKLYLECFPQTALNFITNILARSPDVALEELLLLIIFSENLRILDQVLDESEYRAKAYHFMFRQGIPAGEMGLIFEEIKRISLIPSVGGTMEKLILSRKLSRNVMANPPVLIAKKDSKLVEKLVAELSFNAEIIQANDIDKVKEWLKSNYIKKNKEDTLEEDDILGEVSEQLKGCTREGCVRVVERAIIKSKTISQLESSIPWKVRGGNARAVYLELMNGVKLLDGKSVNSLCRDELLKVFETDVESSYELVMEPLFSKCDTLADMFLAYHREKDSSKKSKLRLAAEYLVEDLGETAEALATHPKFSDSALFEVSKRNLLIIAFVRKCIAHFPLSVNGQWFEYLLKLFSFEVPDRLSQYLKLSEVELWKRVFQPSRRVSISEFRENEEMHLDFQMLVERCGYNPIVRVLNTPVGVMGDLNVIVEANSTNSASLWGLFELEIMLGHLINANVRVESKESLIERSKERVLNEDLQKVDEAESLPVLVMKDTVRSLLRNGNYSALGRVGRSDLEKMDALLKLFKLAMPNVEMSPLFLLETISDIDKIRDIIAEFFTRVKDQSEWLELEEWCHLFRERFLIPFLFGNKPVDVRMARNVIRSPIIMGHSAPVDISQFPETLIDQIPLQFQEYYIYNPSGPFYRRVDCFFSNLKGTLRRHEVYSPYLRYAINAVCRLIWNSRPGIVELVTNIQNIESVTTVDRVPDQDYLTDHYQRIRMARANRLRNREDVEAVIREQAQEMAVSLLAMFNNFQAQLPPSQWEKIKELLLLWVQNNKDLDAYYLEHEYKLTEIYQSMDEVERSAYGILISSPQLYKDRLYDHHVTSKYAFRILGRVSGRFVFEPFLRAGLEKEENLSRALPRETALCYKKLRAIFNHFSRWPLVVALFDVAPIDLISKELEAHFRDQYCDETELPLTLHAPSNTFEFEELHGNLEHIGCLQRIRRVKDLQHIVQEKELKHVLRIFQEDLSVCELVHVERSVLLANLELPPIFNGILGYMSELDGILGQLHVAIASRLILRMPTSCSTRVDLVGFLADHYDSPQEYRARCHSTMAFFEWSTSTIEDLFKRYEWTEERIKVYKSEPTFREHERCIQEYYEYRKMYDVIKSYQARAAYYSTKMKEIKGMIDSQRELAVESGDSLKILYLQEQFDQFKEAYQLNRMESQAKIKILFKTNFVKRRMLKCMQLPIIIQPIIDEVLAHTGDINEFSAQKISWLLSAIHIQMNREIRQETSFAIEEEKQFGEWLESLHEKPPSPLGSPVLREGGFRLRFLSGRESADTVLVPAGSLDYSDGPSPFK